MKRFIKEKDEFIQNFEVSRQYTQYFPHNNVELVIEKINKNLIFKLKKNGKSYLFSNRNENFTDKSPRRRNNVLYFTKSTKPIKPTSLEDVVKKIFRKNKHNGNKGICANNRVFIVVKNWIKYIIFKASPKKTIEKKIET